MFFSNLRLNLKLILLIDFRILLKTDYIEHFKQSKIGHLLNLGAKHETKISTI